MYRYLQVLFFVIVFCFGSRAQPDTASVNSKGYFSFQYENDFFNATDRYFTQGIRLELSHPFVKHSPVSKILFSIGKRNREQYAIALEQQCFTPSSIRRDTVFTGERPYAAVMFISHSRKTVDTKKKQSFTVQADLGAMGTCAVCEQEQKGIHKALDNIEPLGWQYQLSNDVVINYSVLYEKGIFMRRGFEVMGTGKLRAGTLYDDISAGLMIRGGWMQPYFDQPKRNQPFRFYVFAKGNMRVVAYNATLQGGVFNRNNIYTLPASAVDRLVPLGGGGIVLSYKKLTLEYTRVFIREEFKNGLDHGWGHCDIRFSF